jgi:uncharacterized protein (TIGR02266 family)
MKLRVLVVADVGVGRVARRILERSGCEVVVLTGVDEARRALTENPFDAALVDCNLGGRSGLELLTAARKERPSMRLVATSGAAGNDIRDLCARAGADAFVAKPFSLADLKASLLAEPPSEPIFLAADPALDLEPLRSACGGDMKDAHEIASEFVEDARATLQKLERAVEAKDAEELRRLSHKLAGGAGTVGARAVARLAAAIEDSEDRVAEGKRTVSRLAVALDELSRVVARIGHLGHPARRLRGRLDSRRSTGATVSLRDARARSRAKTLRLSTARRSQSPRAGANMNTYDTLSDAPQIDATEDEILSDEVVLAHRVSALIERQDELYRLAFATSDMPAKSMLDSAREKAFQLSSMMERIEAARRATASMLESSVDECEALLDRAERAVKGCLAARPQLVVRNALRPAAISHRPRFDTLEPPSRRFTLPFLYRADFEHPATERRIPISMFEEEHPTSIIQTDRRRETRVPLRIEVTMTSDHNFFIGMSENVSEGGLFISTYEEVEMGSQMDVAFCIPDHHWIRTRAEVCWARRYDRDDIDSTPGFGVRFLDLSAEDARALQDFVRLREPLFND